LEVKLIDIFLDPETMKARLTAFLPITSKCEIMAHAGAYLGVQLDPLQPSSRGARV